MSFNVVIVIQENPFKTHRPVESLRIALGLSTGFPSLKIILLNHAQALLDEEIGDIVDVEILEKYSPVIQELSLPFFISQDKQKDRRFDPAFNITPVSLENIQTIILQGDRVMIF